MTVSSYIWVNGFKSVLHKITHQCVCVEWEAHPIKWQRERCALSPSAGDGGAGLSETRASWTHASLASALPPFTQPDPQDNRWHTNSSIQKKGQFVCLRALVAQDYSLTDHISRLFEKKQITCSDCYCSQALCAHGARLMLYELYFWCWGFRWIYGLWQMIKQKNNKDKNQQIPLAISKALLHVTHKFCLQCL